MNDVKTYWYKDAVVYQIYPRSFCDSNGDGIGDLRGIISKADYLADLGVDAVWLSPCYRTPNDDKGYDISDYRDINPEFGTLDDWKEMVAELHKRNIRVIMDLVVNHCSDEHFWFQEAKKSKDNPYRDYFIWRRGRGKDGKKPPNNWTSRCGGSAWMYDETTDEWFLHLWSKKEPDLNWENPKLREEVHDIVRYWLDLGCDGFRCDVITYLSKTYNPDGTIPNGKWRFALRGDELFLHGPRIHEFLRELNEKVLSRYDCMTVGEATGVTVEQGILYTGEDRKELDTLFQFDHVESDAVLHVIPKWFSLPKFKAAMSRWQTGMYNKGWNALYYENHDQPRSLPRFTGKFGERRKEAAKMLAMSLFFMQGTPYVYEGQELGMSNYKFKSVSEMDDNFAIAYYNIVKRVIGPFAKPLFMYVMNRRSRDQGRFPMAWSSGENAGFTTGKPWLLIHPDFTEINVESEAADETSVLNFYKKLIAYRKGNEIIRNGTFREYFKKHRSLYVYEREYDGKRLLLILNFKNKNVPFKLPKGYSFNNAKVVMSNYDNVRKLEETTLMPYEAIAFEVS